MPETNYKQLWRRGREDNKKMGGLLTIANDKLKAQSEIIRQIRDGEITMEDFKKATEVSQNG